MVLTWLQIWVVGCTSVFAPQDAGVLEASEAMRGHHHESCPRRALQQGELVIDMSHAPGQRARCSVQGFWVLKKTLAPEFLMTEMQKKSKGILLKRPVCGMQRRPALPGWVKQGPGRSPGPGSGPV